MKHGADAFNSEVLLATGKGRWCAGYVGVEDAAARAAGRIAGSARRMIFIFIFPLSPRQTLNVYCVFGVEYYLE